MNTVGVCILSWNSAANLISCIEGIDAQQIPAKTITVVVDNASSDNSVRRVRERYPQLHVIENSSNKGYAAGNNVGARFLLNRGCHFLVFLNPDVVLQNDSLEKLIAALDLPSRSGCAGGVPVTPLGKFNAAARTRPSALEKIVIYGPLRRVPVLMNHCRRHLISHEFLRDGEEIYAAYGACIAFRSEAFREMGLFDEHTFLYEEEFITAERLQRKGWRTVLCTDARYSHVVGASTSLIPYRRRLHFIASEQYLVSKYYGYPFWGRLALRAYRSAEWLFYVVHAWSSRNRAFLRPMRRTAR